MSWNGTPERWIHSKSSVDTPHRHTGIVRTAMFIAISIVVVVLLLTGLRISQEYQRGVIFRLGRYSGLRGPGLFWIIPLAIENER